MIINIPDDLVLRIQTVLPETSYKTIEEFAIDQIYTGTCLMQDYLDSKNPENESNYHIK